MRRIYFVSEQVTQQSVPDLILSLDLWESSYKLVMDAPVGKVLHRLWRHHFGAEAELRLYTKDLLKLESGVNKIISNFNLSPDLRDFLIKLMEASKNARSKRFDMIVIAE